MRVYGPWLAKQEHQQVKLLRAEPNLSLGDSYVSCQQVDADIPRLDRIFLSRSNPTQEGINSRSQLCVLNRTGQVFVRACLQRTDALVIAIAGGDYENSRVGDLSQLKAELWAAATAGLEIGQNQLRRAFAYQGYSIGDGFSPLHIVRLISEGFEEPLFRCGQASQ